MIDAPKRKVAPINRCLIDAGVIEPRRNDEQPKSIHHQGTGRVRLADVQVWEPHNGNRIELSAVEAAIIELHERFGLSALAADPFQAALMIERLQKRGLPVFMLDQVGSTLQAQATAVLDGFRERIVDLFPHDALLSDLQKLQIAERNYGYRLVSPRATRIDTHATAHGDTATAFSIAMLAAKRAALRPSRTIQGRLVCWPTAEAAA